MSIQEFLNNLRLADKPTEGLNQDAIFEKAMPFVFSHEGYKSNDANDPGGLTIWGIDTQSHPVEVKQMSVMTADAAKEVAKNIYYKLYWAPIATMNLQPIAGLAVFDTGVNMGVVTSQKLWEAARYDYKLFLLLRIKRYNDIVSQHPSMGVFLHGWTERVLDLLSYQM